ncbi:MAG: aminodeoxychorismate synthase component I [Propionibacteriales bacterium]|nr:aminodeoxychorismate synthase component I [Propionibacteriales bacterium]
MSAVGPAYGRVFWLDGGGARDWSGRLSYLGWLEPGEVSLTYDAHSRTVFEHTGTSSRVVGDDIFTVLESRLRTGGSPRSQGRFDGWVGYFGYACRPDLPALVEPSTTPDAMWMQASRYAVFDHQRHTVRLHGIDVLPQADPALISTGPDRIDAPAYSAYLPGFQRVQQELRAGNSYEVNLTHRVTVRSEADPVAAYLRLRRINPAPYAAFLQHEGTAVLSSSPERYVTIGADASIETRPIKGTTPRGLDPVKDRTLRDLLRTDPKLRSENLMVTDLLRNDLSIVCLPGTVEVPQLMHVESYPSVHQLITTIRGVLRPDVNGVAATRALFPGGSMTGAPKRRTMQIISEVEQTPRGVYSGAIGWIGDDGRADLGIVIRSLVASRGRYVLGTGGGITVRSDPEQEYAETQWKTERLIQALHPGP